MQGNAREARKKGGRPASHQGAGAAQGSAVHPREQRIPRRHIHGTPAEVGSELLTGAGKAAMKQQRCAGIA